MENFGTLSHQPLGSWVSLGVSTMSFSRHTVSFPDAHSCSADRFSVFSIMQSQAEDAPRSSGTALVAADAYRGSGAKYILVLAFAVFFIMGRLTEVSNSKKYFPLTLAAVSRVFIMNVLVHTGLKVPWTNIQLLAQHLPNIYTSTL